MKMNKLLLLVLFLSWRIFAYTTISGGLGEHTTWTTGTYYITGVCDIGNYNLTLDAGGGNIIIKTSGAVGLYTGGTGNIATANTSNSKKVYFTSKNDNTLGETISGSSGSPAIGDQSQSYFYIAGAGCDVAINHCEFWYFGAATGCLMWYHSGDQVTNDIDIQNVKFRYCSILASCSHFCSFIGMKRYNVRVGNVTLKNIDCNNTCAFEDASKAYFIYLYRPDDISPEFENIYCGANSTLGCAAVFVFESDKDASTITLKNLCFDTKSPYCVYFTWRDNTGTINFSQSIMKKSTTVAVYLNEAGGTLTANFNDNIIEDNTAKGVEQASVTNFTETNNGYYNNGTNATGFTPTNPITTDPALGSLPGGTIYSNWFLPDGYAVTNLSGYEKQGSDTYDNLSIDESKYTMTGYEYAGTDKVTPGCYYEMSVFYTAPSGTNYHKFRSSWMRSWMKFNRRAKDRR